MASRRVQHIAQLLSSGDDAASQQTYKRSDFAKVEAERLARESTQWNAPADIRGLRKAIPGIDLEVIDLGPLFSFSAKTKKNISSSCYEEALNVAAVKLKKASIQTGFHYIVNHGIPKSTIDNALAMCKMYHKKTPLEEKMLHQLGNSPKYTGIGYVCLTIQKYMN